MGEPKPLEVINGVLVKDEREQRRVEKYLKELYEFKSEEDYRGFLDSFIIRDSSEIWWQDVERVGSEQAGRNKEINEKRAKEGLKIFVEHFRDLWG